MKKKTIIVAGAALLSLMSFISCSKSKEAPVKEEKVFTNASLDLKVNGEKIADGLAVYTPSPVDVEKATINAGRPDFEFMGYAIQTNILPGTNTIGLTPDLAIDGEMASFSGSGNSLYCTYDYTGDVSNNGLNLNISNVKVETSPLLGSWAPAAVKDTSEAEWNKLIVTEFKYLDGAKIPEAANLNYVLPGLMRMIPVSAGGQQTNLAVALSNVLKSLTLKENGTASATYVAPEGNTVTSPEKYAFYAPMPNGAAATKGAVLAFPNVADIVTGAMTAPNAVKSDMDVLMSLLPDVLAFAAPMLKSGLPVMYEKKEQITTMYLGKDVFIGILKLFSTLYKKEGIEAFIEGKIYAMMLEQYKIEIAAKAATAGAMLAINTFVDNIIPANINALDEVKVGLNFTQAK